MLCTFPGEHVLIILYIYIITCIKYLERSSSNQVACNKLFAENSLKTEKCHKSDDMGLFWKVCRRNVIHFCYFHYPNKGSCGLVFEKHIFRKKAMRSEKTHITVCAVRLDRRRCVWWDSFNFLSSSENQNKFNWITWFFDNKLRSKFSVQNWKWWTYVILFSF